VQVVRKTYHHWKIASFACEVQSYLLLRHHGKFAYIECLNKPIPSLLICFLQESQKLHLNSWVTGTTQPRMNGRWNWSMCLECPSPDCKIFITPRPTWPA
jgi:hypothetical protein